MKTLTSIGGRISALVFLIVILFVPIELDDVQPEDKEFYL
jgi:hypothetical protein